MRLRGSEVKGRSELGTNGKYKFELKVRRGGMRKVPEVERKVREIGKLTDRLDA